MCGGTWVQIPLRANFLSNIYSFYIYIKSPLKFSLELEIIVSQDKKIYIYIVIVIVLTSAKAVF